MSEIQCHLQCGGRRSATPLWDFRQVDHSRAFQPKRRRRSSTLPGLPARGPRLRSAGVSKWDLVNDYSLISGVNDSKRADCSRRESHSPASQPRDLWPVCPFARSPNFETSTYGFVSICGARSTRLHEVPLTDTKWLFFESFRGSSCSLVDRSIRAIYPLCSR